MPSPSEKDESLSWRWVTLEVVYAVHDRQLAEHGGLGGIRDQGLVESAWARPQQLAAYGNPDAAELAAAYAYGFTRNHAFSDGNKRTAWVVARLFLKLNKQFLAFEALEAIRMMERLAAGQVEEEKLAAWFRQRLEG